MKYVEFLSRLAQLKNGGFVQTHREGDTGVGKTLEDLVGIEENNLDGPDFETYELKSARKSSTSMLTLFTKVPEPHGANSLLLAAYGYPSRKTGPNLPAAPGRLAPGVTLPVPDMPEAGFGNELHVTVEFGHENRLGLSLGLEAESLVVENPKGVPAFYRRAYLQEAFERKYGHKLVYVLADRKKNSRSPEEFHYDEAFLLSGFSFEGFLSQIRKRVVKLDLRMGHYPDGRPHDHGTGFRVLPKELPLCFSRVSRIL